MSVIITNGTVVYHKGKTSVAITEKDGPQSLTAELEARLVSEGVAKYVDKPVLFADKKPVSVNNKKSPCKAVPHTNKSVTKRELTPEGTPKYSVDMKVNDLRELMKECGLTYKFGATKADMVMALDAYYSAVTKTDEVDEDEADDSEESNDTPPNLEASEPVI